MVLYFTCGSKEAPIELSFFWCQSECNQQLVCRHNQQLEQDTLGAEEATLRIQKTADNLSQRLDAIMKDRFSFKSSAFDADTPIDKTLNFLSDYIGVSARRPPCLDLHASP